MTKARHVKRVLVPVNFDQASESTLSYSCYLARAMGAELLLLYNTNTADLTFTQQSRLIKALRTFGEHVLSRQHKPRGAHLRFECVVKPGNLESSVKTVVQDYGVDMILMQANNLKANDKGENHAAAVMELVNVPVMTVPAGIHYRKLKKIVFATDFTDRDPVVLQRIREFAEQTGARLTLVQFYTQAERPQLCTMKKAMLEVEKLFNSDKVQLRLLEEEDMPEGISDFAEQEGADMLMLATQDNYLMKRLYDRAYVKTMAYHTRVPLLTYRQQKLKPCSGSCANCKSKKQSQAVVQLGLQLL